MMLVLIGGSFNLRWHDAARVLQDGDQVSLALPRPMPATVTPTLETLTYTQEQYVKKTFYHPKHQEFEALVYVDITKAELDAALARIFTNEPL